MEQSQKAFDCGYVLEIQNPTVIETSRWTKTGMVKACKAFEVI